MHTEFSKEEIRDIIYSFFPEISKEVAKKLEDAIVDDDCDAMDEILKSYIAKHNINVIK